MEVNKLKEIQENLLICDKPSIYLEEIKDSLKNTPLEVLINLEKIEQNKQYHPEGNVWNHLKQVVDTASKIKDFANDKASFMLGALLHDLGKGTTTKKNKQGRLISYNHDTEGEKIADKLLTYYDYKDEEKKKALNLVKYHMHHLYIIKNLPFAKTNELVKEVDLNDMILMFVSDRLGRGQVKKEKKLNEIEDIEKVIKILEENYGLDLNEIKEKIQKIKKLYKITIYIYSLMNIVENTIILLRYNNMEVFSMNIIGKLNLNKKENKFFYLMVFIFFCVGIALGTYIVKYMNANDASDLTSYFSTFTESIVKEPVNSKVLLLNVLKKNLILITIIIALSFTIFGTPIILLVDLVKGFTLGYTFSFLISTFEGKGLWLALASTIPQNIIYIPCFIALSIVGIKFSSTKLKERFFNKGKVNTIVERELILKIGVFACVFIIGTFIEAYICPNIIKFVVTNVYKVV